MTTSELIEACRLRADDVSEPYLWTDEEWLFGLNEAQNEACVRARILREPDVPLTVAAGASRVALPSYALDVVEVRVVSTGEIMAMENYSTENGDLAFIEPMIKDTPITVCLVRLPKLPITSSRPPEIPVRFHARLVDWALRLAYLKNDADAFNPSAAALHEAMFKQSFGEFLDANVQRKHRRNAPRVVRPNIF